MNTSIFEKEIFNKILVSKVPFSDGTALLMVYDQFVYIDSEIALDLVQTLIRCFNFNDADLNK